MPSERLIKIIHHNILRKTSIPAFLNDKQALRKAFQQLGIYNQGKYLHDQFTDWLSTYTAKSQATLQSYFANKIDLNSVCEDFIQFCFRNNISLDKDKTLQSFEHHDSLSDNAIKKELASFKPRDKVNVLGFGLGNGYYEKTIAQHLIDKKLAKTVKIYGFDPFAEKSDGIKLLTAQKLNSSKTPMFDVITARWVLHHVASKDRWSDFINCINRSNSNGLTFIVEHGFLPNKTPMLCRKTYYLLNATFDVVANIGIRPQWFTNTVPNIGANFFIHYLQPQDFTKIGNKLTIQFDHNIYDVGPNFPNQTICCIRAK